MPKHLRTAVIAAASLAALAVAAPAASAAPAQDLYVATANQGNLARTHTPGVYRLTMAQPGPSVTTFTDRPSRSASALSTRSFVRTWKAEGFAADPPNAALVIDNAPATRDVYTFELSKPRIDKHGRVVFRAKRIGPPSSGPLEQFGTRADQPATGRFGHASLFVDPSSAQIPVQVNVSGLAAGQVARVTFDQFIDLTDSENVTPTIKTTDAAGVAIDDNDLLVVSTHGTMSGTYDIGVDGSSVSGTAAIPAGASVSISINHGAAQPIANGAFSVGS